MNDASKTAQGRLIPWMIVLFFVVLTGVLAAFTVVARRTHTGLSNDAAYERGLAYNATIEKSSAQDKLNLQPTIRAEKSAVLFRLTDAQGRAVSVSSATLWMYRPSDAALDTTLLMKRRGKDWIAAPALPAKGLWEARVRAETAQGPYQASQRLVIE